MRGQNQVYMIRVTSPLKLMRCRIQIQDEKRKMECQKRRGQEEKDCEMFHQVLREDLELSNRKKRKRWKAVQMRDMWLGEE